MEEISVSKVRSSLILGRPTKLFMSQDPSVAQLCLIGCLVLWWQKRNELFCVVEDSDPDRWEGILKSSLCLEDQMLT